MDSFDIDLEDLNLSSVDIKPTNNDFKNISYNSTYQNATPNLTVSSSNNDPMPTALSSDKAVDFGLDLLMNKKKIRPDAEVNKLGSTTTTPTHGQSYNNAGGYPEKISLDNNDLLQKSLFDDNFTNIDLDKELNTLDLNDIAKPATAPSMSGPSLPNFGTPSANGTTNYYNAAASATTYMPSTTSMGSGINTTQMSFEEIQQKKFDLMCKFDRLREKGIRLPKTFSMSSNYEEMDMEYRRLVENRQLDNSVKTQKKLLLSFASGIEFLNNKFDPFNVQLDGWSENVNESMNDGEYDQVFEDLFYKYKDTINMAPELKLAGMVAMSGFWYHLTQNIAKASMPSIVNNVMKTNPELMKQFQQAAMSSMQDSNPAFANFAQNMSASTPPKYNPMSAPPFANPKNAPPRGQTNINSTDDIDALIDSIG